MEIIDEKNPMPLVSIVITSYNRANTIVEAIQSAIGQDYPNLEIVITDNYSTDGTKEVVQKYLSDKRVKFFQNEKNLGMIPNFKRGIEVLSKGEYFLNLCSDDVLWYKSFISDAIKLTNKYPDVTIVRGKSHLVDKATGKILKDRNGWFYDQEFQKGRDFFLSYLGKGNFGLESAMLHRETFKSLNVFRDPDNYYSGFDKASNLSVLLCGNICFINEYCYLFMLHPENAHQNFTARLCMNDFRLVEIPYEIALQRNSIDRVALDAWKNTFINNLATDASKELYKFDDRSEYGLFLRQIEDKYGLKPRDLRKGWRIKVFYFLFYFPAVGRFIAKFKKKIFLLFSQPIN